MITGPLTGVRAVDLSRGIAGAWASMIMADLGAEVIKIETAGAGDEAGIVEGPKHRGQSFCFLAFNRNKKSVVLDLGTASGRQALLDLLKVSDVLIEDSRPGSVELTGLGYEDVKKLNPRIVMWQDSGYGHSGPYKDMACHEIAAQGYSGMLDLTREAPGRPPVKSAPPVGDMGSGFFGLIGVLAALQQRERTGEGQLVRTTMLGACMAMLCYHFSYYFLSHELPKAVGSGHLGMLPQGAYKCKDGYVVIATGSTRIAQLPGMHWMTDDPRFATLGERLRHRDEFNRLLEDHLSKADARVWLELFNREDIPAAPVNNLEQAAEDAQVQEQGLIAEIEHTLGGTIRMIGNPLRMSSIRGEHVSPPVPGQHTEEVLKGLLGYSDDRVEMVRKEQAVNREAPKGHRA